MGNQLFRYQPLPLSLPQERDIENNKREFEKFNKIPEREEERENSSIHVE